MHVREICAGLGYDMSEPSIIYEDNKAAGDNVDDPRVNLGYR